MAGIKSFSAYVPRYRLGQDVVPKVVGVGGLRGERAIANFDEDSLTMAVAAALNCLGNTDRSQIDGLFFATTSPPYKERSSGTIIAATLGLRSDIRIADFTNSLRGGTLALSFAVDAIQSKAIRNALVIAADSRPARAFGNHAQLFGDGAVALLVGESDISVDIEGFSSVFNELMDQWKIDTDNYLRTAEDRFMLTEGYFKIVGEAVSKLMGELNTTATEITKAVIYAPDARSQVALAGKLGFDPRTQLQDSLLSTVGNTGTASALMMLVAVLEEAKQGDRILMANYGNGGDACLLRVVGNTGNNGNSIKSQLASKTMISSYERYLKWRHLMEVEPMRRPPIPAPSVISLWREQKEVLSLVGSKCRKCGQIHYPPQRVCVNCLSKDDFDDYGLSDKKGHVTTYALDMTTPMTPDLPGIFAVVDYEGGGRNFCQMTDCEPQDVRVGMPVEMTLRKLYEVDGINNYFWKAKPA
ncbi:MAG: zinc ribbon domain-containing protein [Chloroflexota bacterium]|nr:zinc ribbon domain-containing protein [Chloroflexota bacterium]